MKPGVLLLAAAFVLSGCAHVDGEARAGVGPAPDVSSVTEAKDLSAVTAIVGEGDAARTIVVFDIDDTLLTSDAFYGSDYWYEWQKTLAPEDPARVPCRFDVIALNYEAGTLHATQPDGPAIVNGIRTAKLILTSRSPLQRGPTVRELQNAGYELPAPLGGVEDGVIYRWRREPSSTPVVVSYHDGLFMTAGQDKGLLLLDLLKRLRLSYGRVVFVDDGRKNIDAMAAALKSAGVEYRGVWYTRVAKPFPVAADDGSKGLQGWTSLRGFLDQVFPARLKQLTAGRCAY